VGRSGGHIELAARGTTIIITLHGVVEESSLGLLVGAIDAAVADDWHSVRVDLGAVDRVTPEGAVALSAVLTRYRGAERRLVYQAPTSAGQSALLAAYAT
jgi:formaldehyde-activating enzyme involved in methanogenesis